MCKYLCTIFDLCDISHHNVCHRKLDDLTSSHHLKLLLLLDAALQATKLLLFTPVIEGSDEHHTHHREQNGSSFNPPSLGFSFVFCSSLCSATCYRNVKRIITIRPILHFIFTLIYNFTHTNVQDQGFIDTLSLTKAHGYHSYIHNIHITVNVPNQQTDSPEHVPQTEGERGLFLTYEHMISIRKTEQT